MAVTWTVPRTWVHGEVVTATMLNEQLRDNESVIKVSRNDLGRVSALNSSTVADLSAANLTGLAVPGAGNTFTTGKTRLRGAARFQFPVGADRWDGTKGVDARGIWVEGDYLHNIASDCVTEYRYLGTLVSTAAGKKTGSGWVEGDCLHYVDADGDERQVEFRGTTAVHTDVNAEGGSLWAETYVHFVRETGSLEKVGHADITHADHSDYYDHDDHRDYGGPHQDTHTDHEDGSHSDHSDHTDHNDYVHADYTAHGDYDPHGDVAHVDHYDHGDYTDHMDYTPHADIAEDMRPVVV